MESIQKNMSSPRLCLQTMYCLQEATSLAKFVLLCNRLLLFWISLTVIVIGSELSYYRTALWDTQQSSRGSFGQIMHTLARQKACEQARNAVGIFKLDIFQVKHK